MKFRCVWQGRDQLCKSSMDMILCPSNIVTTVYKGLLLLCNDVMHFRGFILKRWSIFSQEQYLASHVIQLHPGQCGTTQLCRKMHIYIHMNFPTVSPAVKHPEKNLHYLSMQFKLHIQQLFNTKLQLVVSNDNL